MFHQLSTIKAWAEIVKCPESDKTSVSTKPGEKIKIKITYKKW